MRPAALEDLPLVYTVLGKGKRVRAEIHKREGYLRERGRRGMCGLAARVHRPMCVGGLGGRIRANAGLEKGNHNGEYGVLIR